MDSEFHHKSVLLEAALECLRVRPGGTYLDGTLGGGGHASAILAATEPDGILVGIDRDPDALAAATQRLQHHGERFQPIHGTFAEMESLASQWGPFDGILLDLGVSSPQLDRPERGFRFRADGPVDMRMDTSQAMDAATLIDELSPNELVTILRRYGEEPRAKQIARAIIEGRPWSSTKALADCIAAASVALIN